jgi:hypothetical protein
MRARCWSPSYLCATIGFLGACTSSPTGPSETKGFQVPPGATLFLVVAPSEATIKGGRTLRLTANRKDAQGPSLAPTEVEWTSSNIKVARIGSDGTVVGAAGGTAQITAQWHGLKGVSTVTVLGNEPPAGPCANLAVAAVGATAPAPSKCGGP